MSTDIDQTCYTQDSAGCDCTMSTLPGGTATVVAGKVGDDFQMYPLIGINGTSALLVGGVIEIDGGAGATSLQAAYDGGNTIVVAGGDPVDIATGVGVHQPLLNIHDAGNTGLFTIDSTGLVDGDALVRLSNDSGLLFNNPIDKTLAPTIQDPFTRLQADAAPSATLVTSTIANAANAAAINAANAAYSYTIPVNSVSMIELTIVGRSAGLAASFTTKLYIKADLTSATQGLLISNQLGADAALAGMVPDVNVVAGVLYAGLTAGPATNYVVRNFSVVSVLNY